MREGRFAGVHNMFVQVDMGIKNYTYISSIIRDFNVFTALSTPHGFRSNLNGNEKKVVFFFTFLCVKDCVGFKSRREISRYEVVPFAILTNFGFNLSMKACALENPYEMASFWLVFSAKNPVKSDKLVLIIEGKILNLIFLAIYIPVVPIENWLRVTHREKKNPHSARPLYFVPAGSPFIDSCLNFLTKATATTASSTTMITSRQRPVF